MTSNGNIFRVTGQMGGGGGGVDVFFDLASTNGWVNNRHTGDIWDAHYDVTVI